MNNILIQLTTNVSKNYFDAIEHQFSVTPILFSGGEVHVQLPELSDFYTMGNIKNTYACIKCIIQDSNDLIAVRLVADAIEHLEIKLSSIVIPYLPYARQDRVCAKGQAFSKEVFRKMFDTYYIETWDIHSEDKSSVSSIGVHNLIQGHTFLDKVNKQNSILVSPDKGAMRRVQNVREYCCRRDIGMVVGSKTRNTRTGWIESYTLEDNTEDRVDGKDCFIIDDICDGGATFKILAKSLKDMGAKSVTLFVTHGIFSKGWESLIDSGIDEVYTTNSLPQSDTFPKDNIIVVDEDFNLIGNKN